MSRSRTALIAAILFCCAGPAQAQFIQNPLLVGNFAQFRALDVYNGDTGAYLSPFAGIGPGAGSAYIFAFGPNGNLFVSSNVNPAPLLQFNGATGNFINTFVANSGFALTFGPDGNLYRSESNGIIVRRYNGSNGQPIGDFISSNLSSPQAMRFGPAGDLYIADGATIKRFSGSSGAFVGNFTQPGAVSAMDFLFTDDGRLLASDSITGTVLQFDSSTGNLIGTLAQGNGLNQPFGLAIGPDDALYVASGFGGTIKRFNPVSGAFLGDLVSATAHSAPTFIAFAPNPIPEPSSCLLLATISTSIWAGRAMRNGAQRGRES